VKVTGEGRTEDQDRQDHRQDSFGRDIDPQVCGSTEDVRPRDPDFRVDKKAIEKSEDEDEARVRETDKG
jgi:hypothetical protein